MTPKGKWSCSKELQKEGPLLLSIVLAACADSKAKHLWHIFLKSVLISEFSVQIEKGCFKVDKGQHFKTNAVFLSICGYFCSDITIQTELNLLLFVDRIQYESVRLFWIKKCIV